MSWVRFEDDFYENEKFEDLPDAAFRLWVCAIAYSNRLMTDGFISKKKLKAISPSSRRPLAALSALVRGHLAHDLDVQDQCDSPLCPCHLGGHLGVQKKGGFVVHDYFAYQPSSAEIKEKSKRKSAAGRRGGLARAKALAKGSAKHGATGLLHEVAKQNCTPTPTPTPTIYTQPIASNVPTTTPVELNPSPPAPKTHNWKPGMSIATTADLEKYCSVKNLCAGLSSTEIQTASNILSAGPIAERTIEEALRQTTKARRKYPVRYLLSTVIGIRESVQSEKAKGASAPPVPTRRNPAWEDAEPLDD